jgi:hypothetical protein
LAAPRLARRPDPGYRRRRASREATMSEPVVLEIFTDYV